MRAAVFEGPTGSWPRNPLQLVEVDTPSLQEGEVLVEVKACGLCHTDLNYMKGGLIPPKGFPIILGHEVTGIVEEIDPSINDLRKGDRVILAPHRACGVCEFCQRGRENLCSSLSSIGGHEDGGLAEYLTMTRRNVFRLPAGLPLEESSIIADAVATPFHALLNIAGVGEGIQVAIFGATGGLGMAAVQIAKAYGSRVIAIGRKEWKLDMLENFGADQVVNAREHRDLPRHVTDISNGGVDVALDVTGASGITEMALRSIKPGGMVVVAGYSLENLEISSKHLMWFEKGIVGCRLYNPSDLPGIVALVEEGLVDVVRMVTEKLPLEEVNEGYQLLDSGEVVRALTIP